MKKIILYSLVLLSISSCTKKTDVIESPTIVFQYISPNYLIKEDFEMGKKTAYAIGDVAIKTGSWSFDDALLGQLAADIKKDSYPYLDKLADTLNKAKNWTLEIQGHTDDKGSDDYNMKLSQGRADAVKNYLITKGVLLDTITAKGFGESVPLVPNDSDANREKNRRVEFKITKPNNQVVTTIVQ